MNCLGHYRLGQKCLSHITGSQKDSQSGIQTVKSPCPMSYISSPIPIVDRHPHQTSDEFDLFPDRIQLPADRIKSCKPHCIVITGDFNCRSKQWWPWGCRTSRRIALDEVIESINLSQLIDEPTNIRTTGMSCIDLIITDQLNLFVDFRVHSSLDDHCQIIHRKLNISVPSPPAYKRKNLNRQWEIVIGLLFFLG